ncbi:TKL protein kinase [Globisporangium polare]
MEVHSNCIDGSSTYDYECFRYNATLTFAFYVPYGTAYKSPQELVGTSTPERSDAPNPTLQWPSENNGKGGPTDSNLQSIWKGRVANVAIDPQTSSQLTASWIILANLNLAPIADQLGTVLPAKTTKILSLDNTLLTKVPSGLTKLTALENLWRRPTSSSS